VSAESAPFEDWLPLYYQPRVSPVRYETQAVPGRTAACERRTRNCCLRQCVQQLLTSHRTSWAVQNLATDCACPVSIIIIIIIIIVKYVHVQLPLFFFFVQKIATHYKTRKPNRRDEVKIREWCLACRHPNLTWPPMTLKFDLLIPKVEGFIISCPCPLDYLRHFASK